MDGFYARPLPKDIQNHNEIICIKVTLRPNSLETVWILKIFFA
jgi:hypothetical protein